MSHIRFYIVFKSGSGKKTENVSILKRNKQNKQEFFESQNLEILQWPANSPDLSPIENLLKILKDTIEKNTPKNKRDLIDAIKLAAGNIPRQIQQNLMNSLPSQINLCISAHGETIKYWVTVNVLLIITFMLYVFAFLWHYYYPS